MYYFVLFGSVWLCKVLYGLIWLCMVHKVLPCPVWFCISALGSFGWSCTFLCSPGKSYTFLRQWSSRYRISAHTLWIGSGCYTCPVTPILDRKCKYCRNGLIDDEKHFIHDYEIFKIKRQCFLNWLNVLNPNFGNMTYYEKLTFVLCPLP